MGEEQKMDVYSHKIKSIIHNLAMINSSTPQSDLVRRIFLGFRCEYKIVISSLTHIRLNLPFDDLCLGFLLQEQPLYHLDGDDPIVRHSILTI